MPSFHNPVRIEYGIGVFEHAIEFIGDPYVVITSPGMLRRGVIDRLRARGAERITHIYADVDPNPTIQSIVRASDEISNFRPAWLMAVGGGSVLDTAKGVSAQLSASPGWLGAHLLEGAPFPEQFRPVPLIAVPTTAGTGSEVTMWGTIWDSTTGLKHSLSHPALYPAAAFVDPELTLSAPRELTVTTALDALSHAMESIWNRKANPISDVFAERAIAAIATALPSCVSSPSNMADRAQLHLASLFAGLAISATQTALAHSISYPLTGELGVPHGLACSATLPEILRLNGQFDAERVRPILLALGCHSVDEATGKTADLLASVGAAELLRRYLNRDSLTRIHNSFIDPRRAGNNLCPIDNDGAKAILIEAMGRFGIE